MAATEAMVEVPGGRVWTLVVGGGDKVPLVVLHGGPGFPHDYVRSLEALADERPVVFYDQLGCGRSDRPQDLSLWTLERALQELAAVLAALELDRIHLLGQSWGSMLAVEYALTQPGGIVSLVLASPCISIPRWVEDAERFRSALPPDVQDVIRTHEEAGFTSCPEYQAAMLVFYRRHVCRMDPWPVEWERAIAGQGSDVYQTMWGPSEFTVTGRLKSFDRSARLGEIGVPSLFTCGRFDEATPETVAWYRSLLPGAELAVFEASAHFANLEERDRYNRVIRDFVGRMDRV